MDIEVNKKNGETFNLESIGIMVKDFVVSSISIDSVYSELDGSHRRVDHGATYGTRTITVPFVLRAYDLLDFPLLRDFLFSLVVDTESFYVHEKRRAKKRNYGFVDTTERAKMDTDTDNKLVGGKRYLVRLQNTFDLDQVELDGEGVLVFETTELPFAESIGTTQNIHIDGINAEKGLWGFGMGLIADDESLIYTHTANTFRIYNAGNLPVHPFEQDLKITIDNVVGSTSFLQLENETNGSVFRVTEAVNQTVEIDGANVTINGLQALRKTNREYIELDVGWNTFKLTGATSARVAFDARFYYL